MKNKYKFGASAHNYVILHINKNKNIYLNRSRIISMIEDKDESEIIIHLIDGTCYIIKFMKYYDISHVIDNLFRYEECDLSIHVVAIDIAHIRDKGGIDNVSNNEVF